MKVRVCPKCGKHNDANAFNCADCGTTLSIKTLMDLDSGKLLNVKPIAGYTELTSISPYFEQDVEEMIKYAIPFNEKILWGCNITHLPSRHFFKHIIVSRSTFWHDELRNYLFGYTIITDQRLICVYFTSDDRVVDEMLFPFIDCSTTITKPLRSCFHSRDAIGVPEYELSPEEKSSRQIATCLLSDLESIRIEPIGNGDFSLSSLIIKLKQGDEISIDFLGIHQAEKAHKLLAGNQEKQGAH